MGSHQSLTASSSDQRMPEVAGGGEVRIDINPDHSRQIIERVDRRKRSSFDRATKMMIDMTLAIGGQTIGAVALTSCGGGGASSWPLYFVEMSIIFGLSLIFAAISLRSKIPDISTVIARFGAIVIALAIIFSVTSHLPPLLAFTAGPFALLVISVAVAFASSN